MGTSNDVVVRPRPLEGQALHIVDGLFKPDFVAMLHAIAPANVLYRGGTPSRICVERRLVLVAKFKAASP